MTHSILGLDARYTVAKEFCGYVNWMYVARFCGEWIGAYNTKAEAEQACKDYEQKRMSPYN